MHDTKHDFAFTEWTETLQESEADFAAGRIVSGDIVRQALRDSITRMKADAVAEQKAPSLRR